MKPVLKGAVTPCDELPQASKDLKSLDLVQFDRQDVHVIFSPETFQLFRLGRVASAVVSDARGGLPLSEVAAKHKLDQADVARMVRHISDAVHNAPGVPSDELNHPPNDFLGPALGKLVLMVNTYCNLKCSYCYELNTVFGKRAIDMPLIVLKAALDKFFAAFQQIDTLMFIGGEPTLSETVVEAACAYAIQCAQRRQCPPPVFSLITNGSRMTDRMFEIVARYEIHLTFSVDGPKKVHDLVRIRHDGSGSYDAAAKNLRRYSAVSKCKPFIEATLTHAHRRAHVTASDLIDFFASEFDVKSAHIVPAGLPATDPLNPYRDDDPYIEAELEAAAAKSIDNLFEQLLDPENARRQPRGSLDSVADMLRSVLAKESRTTMCPAGHTQLVVDAFGDIYPCWMFAGMDQFKMGNVLHDDIASDLSRNLLKRIHGNSKRRNPQCASCYARYVCHACIGNNQNSTGLLEQTDERYCTTVRGAFKTVLLKIGEVRQDPGRWERIKGAMKSRGRQEQC